MIRRPVHAALLVMLLLPTGLTASAAQPLCPVPVLEAGPEADWTEEEAAMTRSREALDRFAACLAEHADAMALFDPDAAMTLRHQREAALQLRRTLDAWAAAARLSEARRPAL